MKHDAKSNLNRSPSGRFCTLTAALFTMLTDGTRTTLAYAPLNRMCPLIDASWMTREIRGSPLIHVPTDPDSTRYAGRTLLNNVVKVGVNGTV